MAAAARSHSGPAAATGSHTRTLLARIAAILNVFGGVLTFKRKAEEALEASGLPYVIVRPGGMERPRDDHKLTHNVRLATRDKLFGGTVSRLQVSRPVCAAPSAPPAGPAGAAAGRKAAAAQRRHRERARSLVVPLLHLPLHRWRSWWPPPWPPPSWRRTRC